MGWVEEYKKMIQGDGARPGLSQEQAAVVSELHRGYGVERRPLRVLAAAGSGKTRVMVATCAFLINEKVANPRDIVLTTFTRKARGEMAERLEKVLPPGAIGGNNGIRVATYHSLAYSTVSRLQRTMKPLQREHQWSLALNLDISGKDRSKEKPPQGFDANLIKTVAWLDLGDLWERIATMGKIPGLNEAVPSVKEKTKNTMDPKDLARSVDVFRSYGVVTPAEALAAGLVGDPDGPTWMMVSYGWELYNRCKEALNAWDFGDVLQSYANAVKHGADRARLFITDEAQDNTKLQMDIARGMSQNDPQGRAAYVGDCRQSIYAFRGAQPEILGEADKTENAMTLELTTNYRSVRLVVDAGNAISAGQDWSVGSPAVAHRAEAGKIDFMYADTEVSRARRVAQIVRAEMDTGAQPKSFAVLSRTRAKMAPFEVMFLLHNVPAKVQGGSPFFKSKPIRRVMAYARLALGAAPSQVLRDDFRNAVRDMGEATGAKFRVKKDTWNEIWEAAGVDQELTHRPNARGEIGGPGVVRAALSDWFDEETSRRRGRVLLWGDDQDLKEAAFQNMLDGLELVERAVGEGVPAKETVEALAVHLAKYDVVILPDLKPAKEGEVPEEGTTAGEGDSDREMLGALAEIAEGLGTLKDLCAISLKAGGLAELVGEDERSTAQEVANAERSDDDKVVVGTVHSSKGLEWPTVFLLSGTTEIPHMGIDEPEERRLFYVGCTRAMNRLVLAAVPAGKRPPGVEGPPSDYVSLVRRAEERVAVAVVVKAPVVETAPDPVIAEVPIEEQPVAEDPLIKDYLALRVLFEQTRPELLAAFDSMREDVIRHMANVRAEVEAKMAAAPVPEGSTNTITLRVRDGQWHATQVENGQRRVFRTSYPAEVSSDEIRSIFESNNPLARVVVEGEPVETPSEARTPPAKLWPGIQVGDRLLATGTDIALPLGTITIRVTAVDRGGWYTVVSEGERPRTYSLFTTPDTNEVVLEQDQFQPGGHRRHYLTALVPAPSEARTAPVEVTGSQHSATWNAILTAALATDLFRNETERDAFRVAFVAAADGRAPTFEPHGWYVQAANHMLPSMMDVLRPVNRIAAPAGGTQQAIATERVSEVLQLAISAAFYTRTAAAVDAVKAILVKHDRTKADLEKHGVAGGVLQRLKPFVPNEGTLLGLLGEVGTKLGLDVTDLHDPYEDRTWARKLIELYGHAPPDPFEELVERYGPVDTEPAGADWAYFTSARKGEAGLALSGPYESHEDAIRAVDHDRRRVDEQNADPFAEWAYGTARMPRDTKVWAAAAADSIELQDYSARLSGTTVQITYKKDGRVFEYSADDLAGSDHGLTIGDGYPSIVRADEVQALRTLARRASAPPAPPPAPPRVDPETEADLEAITGIVERAPAINGFAVSEAGAKAEFKMKRQIKKLATKRWDKVVALGVERGLFVRWQIEDDIKLGRARVPGATEPPPSPPPVEGENGGNGVSGVFAPTNGDACYVQLLDPRWGGVIYGTPIERDKPTRLVIGTPVVCMDKGGGVKLGVVRGDGFQLIKRWNTTKDSRNELNPELERMTHNLLGGHIPRELHGGAHLVLLYAVTAGEPFRVERNALVGINRTPNAAHFATAIQRGVDEGWLHAAGESAWTWAGGAA